MSTAGASIMAIGYILPLCYLTWSLKYGKIAGNNPWKDERAKNDTREDAGRR